ncbi:Gag-Pol polyprotein [Thelohanellus kitauei]|uniref:Gag-Pol polyprotein n=1 Tax=Thelohanellus kitauei TaxID=669202 RepID=A0A0C2N3X1_THEKT|nr:Gag-Pol polyprotein [Thelohanellus kitauei]
MDRSIPITKHGSREGGRGFVDQFICRFGAPEIIHTDQGKNFESKLFHHMCNVLGIIKTRTTPYRPQSDGMIEGFNRTLGNMLTKSLSIIQNVINYYQYF